MVEKNGESTPRKMGFGVPFHLKPAEGGEPPKQETPKGTLSLVDEFC